MVNSDAGDGALFIVGVRVQPLLERPVRVGVDPVILHPLQRFSGFYFSFQSQEFIIARFQGKAVGDRLQRAGLVPEVAAQLANLQPDPGVVRLLLHAPLRIVKGFLQLYRST